MIWYGFYQDHLAAVIRMDGKRGKARERETNQEKSTAEIQVRGLGGMEVVNPLIFEASRGHGQW